ncbi:MAG: alpha/beta fold hydrolase [Steroidobacteraceae bacterium]
MATVVLVHGAWGGSFIWREIAAALRKAGHEVYTPTLTGLGERRHLLRRGIDLDTHIEDVLGVIDYEDLERIVLVGHSYGGMVVTGVADAVPEKIASLVYVDAFVPRDGESLVEIRPAGAPLPSTEPGEDWLAARLPADAFGNASAKVRDYVERKSSPQPVACFTQPVKLSGGLERIRRKTYIYCNDPAPTTFTPFYERLRNDPGWTVHTLPCTHFVQFDMPGELTALLLRAIPRDAAA